MCGGQSALVAWSRKISRGRLTRSTRDHHALALAALRAGGAALQYDGFRPMGMAARSASRPTSRTASATWARVNGGAAGDVIEDSAGRGQPFPGPRQSGGAPSGGRASRDPCRRSRLRRAQGFRSPSSRRSRVDLPEPEAPTMAMLSPGRASNSMLSSVQGPPPNSGRTELRTATWPLSAPGSLRLSPTSSAASNTEASARSKSGAALMAALIDAVRPRRAAVNWPKALLKAANAAKSVGVPRPVIRQHTKRVPRMGRDVEKTACLPG